MRRLLPLLLVLATVFPLPGHSDVVTRIHDIDPGSLGEGALIFLATGQVVSYPQATNRQLNELRLGMQSHRWYRIKLSPRHEILAAKVASAPRFSTSLLGLQREAPEAYHPSVLPALEAARTQFAEARRDFTADSQCYDRAHTWAYDWRRRQLYTSKTWLFFTRRYIRKHKFDWWFHVAPSVHVVIDGKVRERVMDIKYTQGPLPLKEWTDVFIRDNAHCPVVETYREHADFPESGSCFVMKSSMYYYRPLDLELLDLTGIPRDRWEPSEVQHALHEAFRKPL